LIFTRIDGANEIKHLHTMSVAATEVEIGSLITRTPGIKSGTPHIAGTGVTVRTIVRWHQSGLTPEEIAVRIGHLSLSQVHAALAYYYANQDVMDREMAAEEAESDRIEREYIGQRQGENRA
jgi:uncharacterized protein (DUF433 family)